MKTWAWLALALLVPGGSVLALAVWCRRRWLARDDAAIVRLIKPPRQIFTGHDDGLRKRTDGRRQRAEAIRSDARKVETRDDARSTWKILRVGGDE